VFVAMCAILIGSQIYFRMKGAKPPIEPSLDHTAPPGNASLTAQTPAE
jgi:hypothetical protein